MHGRLHMEEAADRQEKNMRLIQADCTIRYSGRCETFLEEANRLILIKDDGSVMIHVDSGIKPLNYMKSSTNIRFVEQDDKLSIYAANKKEELLIDIVKMHNDIYLDFPDSEREMRKTGTEDLLQGEIFTNLASLIPGDVGVCREFETGKGPVDVLGRAADGSSVSLVEVKRHAHRKDVYQTLKYGDGIDAMVTEAEGHGFSAIEAKQKGDHDESGEMIPIDAFKKRRLYLASRKFARGTKEEAQEHGVGIIEVNEEEREELCSIVDEMEEGADVKAPDPEQPERD